MIVATDADLSNRVLDVSNLTDTSLTVAGGILARGVIYYWRVEAVNEAGSTSGSPATASFSTLCEGDFNEDGTTNSQDFFDFLAAFFAGCP